MKSSIRSIRVINSFNSCSFFSCPVRFPDPIRGATRRRSRTTWSILARDAVMKEAGSGSTSAGQHRWLGDAQEYRSIVVWSNVAVMVGAGCFGFVEDRGRKSWK